MNILLIVADQWRGDFLPTACGGSLDLPNLDALAKRGTAFCNHYCNASPCGPARMSLLTGQYAMNHRVVQNGIPLAAHKTNLAQEMRKQGLLTGLVGYTSWIPDPNEASPSDPRFTMYGANMPGFVPIRSFEEPEFEAYFAYLRSVGYDVPENPFDLWRDTVTNEAIKASPVKAEHSDTKWMSDAAIEFVNGRGKQPWGLFLGYWRPHPPLSVSAPYHQWVAPENTPTPKRMLSKSQEASTHPIMSHIIDQVKAGDYLEGASGLAADLPSQALANARAVYCGLMKEIDDQLGHLMACLSENGVFENTLVIFTSDHGEMLGDHYLFGKESTFDQSFHIPLIVCDPREKADPTRGTQIGAFTEHVDIMPTILESVHAPVPRQCDGQSLAPLLNGVCTRLRDHAHMEMDFRDLRQGKHQSMGLNADQCGASILRGERYKYAHFSHMPPLLYDMQNDPHELNNLAEEDAYKDVLSQCRADLLNWRISSSDRTLTAVSSSPKGILGWPNNHNPGKERRGTTEMSDQAEQLPKSEQQHRS